MNILTSLWLCDMKVGDMVYSGIIGNSWETGIIVGFNEKGEGGKDFVHVLVNGEIIVCMSFDLFVVRPEAEADV